MSLATREQVNAETDRIYFDDFPNAPRQLDPNNPDHAGWIQNWLAIRDRVLNEWTDWYFFGFFPDAPARLDPGDSSHADLIRYWNDIRDQLRDGRAGQWDWSAMVSSPRVISVVHDDVNGGWVVTLDRVVRIDEAKSFIWPNGFPVGPSIGPDNSAVIRLHGLTIESVQQMRQSVAKFITPQVLTSD